MVEIKKEYGIFNVLEDGKEILKTGNYELVKTECQARFKQMDELSSTYVFSEETIIECGNMLYDSIDRVWGDALYKGDCIKVEIKVSYCQEDK